MKIDSVRSIYTNGEESLLVSTRKPKVFQKLLDTGAVVEKGIVLETVYGTREEDLLLPNDAIETNSKPTLPYLVSGNAYYPLAESEEILELYKALKTLLRINEKLDVRQKETLMEQINMFQYNMFFGKEYGKTSAKLKELCFFLWLLCGTLNAAQGKTVIYILNFLCAALQVDYFTLIPMIMASSISTEKKKEILELIKSNCINQAIIERDKGYVGLYTRINEEDASILGRTR